MDEPLSALDVSAQAQIANLLLKLSSVMHVGLLLISHDLAIVRQIADTVAVMYLGLIVESGPAEEIWTNPLHPYTQALIKSIPRVDQSGVLPESLLGEVPDPAHPPTGCRFHPRCPFRIEKCFTDEPRLEEVALGQQAACWVTMDRARKEMDADNLIDIRPGAGSGLHKGEITD